MEVKIGDRFIRLSWEKNNKKLLMEYKVTDIAEGLVELKQVKPPHDVRDIPLTKLLAHYRPCQKK